MLTEFRLLKRLERVEIELISAEVLITTHSQPTLLVDYRKNVTEELVPRIDCYKQHIRIHQQKLSACVMTKQQFKLKIIVPEYIDVSIKLFSGESTISGLYNKLKMKQRYGLTRLNAGHYQPNTDSLINIVCGELIVYNCLYKKLNELNRNKLTLQGENEIKTTLTSDSIPFRVYPSQFE